MKRILPSCAAAIALLVVPAASAAQSQSGAVLRVDRAHHRVRLGDGKELRLAKRQLGRRGHHHRAHHSSVQINLQGLEAGQIVLITETVDVAGNLTITIKLVPGADPNGDDQDVSGTITAIGAGSVTIQADDGSRMTFQAASDVIDGFEVGDAVDVTYYAEADGTLVADDIEPADAGGGDGGDELDAIGVVSAIGADSITIQVDGGGPITFASDPDLNDGFEVGDAVDVTYSQDPDGTFVADDVEFVDDSGE